ncbi:MAG TPA: diguanylate cyclase [Actinoplanes sp.]|nr:diguanylate cyclase [Actinoplanes sp.]
MTPTARAAAAAHLEELELLTARDFEAVSAPAAIVELQARDQGWTDLVQRAELIIADVAGRRGDVAEQGRVARRINLWAEEHGDELLLARSHRLLAIAFRRLGDPAQALVHAVAGLQHAGTMSERLRCNQLITLGLVLDLNGRFDDARRRFTEAMRIADAHNDSHQTITILNNMAFTAYENGDIDEANSLARQMASVAATSGMPLDGLYLDTSARILMLQERWTEAEQILQPVLDDPDGPLLSEGDSLPECLMTLAEIYAAQGRRTLVGDTLDTVGRICEDRGLGSIAARVHRARAEWHADAGDYREAYQEYQLYHSRTETLHSAEREARAYAMQALFDTTEARQASVRFQRMAERDALTGLFNRRYLDDRLTTAVAEARRTGDSLALAIIDLDHFKRINDTLSHAVGDAVLQQIGTLLETFATGDETPARLGGEEFVLLLPGAGPAAAHHRCEALATLIRTHDWTPTTGSLPVTASIGVATCTAGDLPPNALLSQADKWLYVAKHNGRDQVQAAPSAPALP